MTELLERYEVLDEQDPFAKPVLKLKRPDEMTAAELYGTIQRLRGAWLTECFEHADALQAYRDAKFGKEEKPADTAPEYPGYFGRCPTCRRDDGYLNVQRVHFFVCHEHRCCWDVGANLFSSWKEENEEIWQRNETLLRTYAVVKPVHADPSEFLAERK